VSISVFLLDDHEIVRRGIAQLLEAEDDIVVVGEAGTAAQGMARIPALRPAVAILDVRLPDGEGVAVCRDIRSSTPPSRRTGTARARSSPLPSAPPAISATRDESAGDVVCSWSGAQLVRCAVGQVRSWLRRPASTMLSPSSSSAAPS
jgi:CheY-like chemotaxis protein